MANWVWDLPLLLLLLGGGAYFLLRSRLLPMRHLGHAIRILRGRLDRSDDSGEISHANALSIALASCIGMGNISGVAIAIDMGGPGVIFWMWLSAILGMATKYFTCTLAILYRGVDSRGVVQGGPMYVIEHGLGPAWRPLAVLFCLAGMIGCLPVFNVNQLADATEHLVLKPLGVYGTGLEEPAIGAALALITVAVARGGLKRIANFTTNMVSSMVVLYFIAVTGIVLTHLAALPSTMQLIVVDAFEARFYDNDSILGGVVGGLIVLGARRAAFSNEAGIGTASMAHGSARTNKAVHEGMVAMLGPLIDTLLVCTLTALAILTTGVWMSSDSTGVLLTAEAFRSVYPTVGGWLLYVCIFFFSLSSLLSYAWFGSRCASYLFGAERARHYLSAYIISIFIGATSTLGVILYTVDIAYALMAIPTMISALLLSPRVVQETRTYFQRITAGGN